MTSILTDTLHQFIQSKTVGDILNKVKPIHRELVDLPSTATMEEAFDLLLAEDILSVPVYNLKSNDVKEYVAIVSVLDLLKFLNTKVSLENLQDKADLLLIPVSEIVDKTTERLTILTSSDKLEKLLQLFTVKIHRVLIEQDNKTYVLLSQMDLVRYFQENNHNLGSSVLDLNISNIKSPGIFQSINYKSTAAEAFLKLAADKRISALPILDDSGDLIGEISAQDLRGLNRNRWETLSKPVVMFLKASHGDLMSPLTCHDRFTLSQIMSAFVLRNAHRLWWMDYESGRLKGVASLTDILSVFSSDH